MYAAAGGASLASRQARQRQRQQKKTQQLQAKLHPPKAAGLASDHAAEGASTPTRSQSRQFHQLPQNYLRAPQPHGRKLSATYTTQSKLLLPIEEGDTQSVSQLRMHSHAHSHGHAYAHSHSHSHGPAHAAPAPLSHHGQTPYQQFASSHGRVSPKLVHRHSGSSSSAGFHPVISAGQLHKSATATLPLVSHMEAEAMAVSPSAVAGVKTTVTSLETATPTSPPLASTSAAAAAAMAAEAEAELAGAGAMFVPHHDAIIVTPATPMASPGHVAKLRRPGPEELLFDSSAERQPLTADETLDDEDEPMHPPAPGQLERKCSVYRMRRSDAFEQDTGGASGGVGGAGGGLKRQLRELQFSTGVQQTQYEPLLADEPQLIFKGLGVNGRKMQICAYCEEGICVCEHLECAQGRAAWLERGRRCSVQDQQQQQATCHRRWVKRNRIQDASLGGSSDDEDFLGVLRGPSTFANAFLYVGLGTVALGLVIAFVGTGEKGFKTTELRLIGPSLIGLGLICCILRILFCICPSHCISSSKKTRKKNGNKIDADHTTSLLRNESKRVSIARGPSFQVPKYPIAHKRSQSKMLNEGMEALRQIATTSLFMQNEQKTAINRVVPIINEPESGDAPLEMKKLQTALNACEMSDDEQDQDQDQQKQQQQQIAKRTTATTAVTSSTTKDPTSTAATSRITRATTLSTVDEKPDSKLVRQRVALQQQRQQQQQQQDQQHVPKSQSLSSSSTVKDSLEVMEETSLIDASNETTTPVATTAASSTAPMPSSCSTGAIPRLNRPGISTGATPKTTTTTTTPTITARLPTSQSHPTSYDLPPALPHTYSATATVRGPLGMSMSSSTSGKGMGTAFTLPPTTTAISLLPLPAPSTVATASSTSTTIASIPGQVLESSGVTSLSLSLMRPATASGVVLSGLTTSSFTTGTDLQKSHPSSAGSVMGRGSSLLLSPPTAAAASSSSSSSKFEPELVLSPANLGQ
ncbi:uncharacterized protein LOC117150657 isoform X1 [Drosophila mauritiana]|uniref:Uncharacterized protein LOC117150657 isoform X1 n=1 Tax=Drosophila mauritiana TaxID=7226 RepID=A0A6P8LDX7_DROMA|nr:uncharacterized protein LOC117150657 isoform X1 [Drosophila mauritiana]